MDLTVKEKSNVEDVKDLMAQENVWRIAGRRDNNLEKSAK
jgi:hypothetical protein